MSRLDGQLMMQRVIGLIKALRLHLQFVNQYLSGQIYVIASSGKGYKIPAFNFMHYLFALEVKMRIIHFNIYSMQQFILYYRKQKPV